MTFSINEHFRVARSHPSNWRTIPRREAQRRWGELRLPVQLMPLPTYASWINFIEKLWRWLKQEVLHMHRLADWLEDLREEVDSFLDRFANGSQALLRYVGLSVPD
ncbi:MAG: transposase [Chloroflexi bacterium]|nr:transposase [Chloroflexota bacterium]